MKKTLFLALVCVVFAFLLPSFDAYAQNSVAGTTASVVSYWKKGDTKRFSVRISKDKDVSGKLSREAAVYDVTMRVLDETDKSYTVEWTYEKSAAQVSNALIARLYEMSTGLRVIYRTDELGAFTELLNWKEVQAYIYKSLDMLESQSGGNQGVKAVVSRFKEIYSSREGIESTLKDISLYHSLYGGEYTLNEKVTADTLLPNILGGGSIPAKIEVQMTELKPELDYCKIVTKKRVDSEKTTELVREFLKKTAEQSGKPLPKEAEIPVMNVEDTSEHEIELAQGWVKRAYFKREIQSGPARQTDTYEIIEQK